MKLDKDKLVSRTEAARLLGLRPQTLAVLSMQQKHLPVAGRVR